MLQIKQSGNDLIGINSIAEKVNIQITVHAINRDIVHSTIDKDIKIIILVGKNPYDSIVNISGFNGAERKMYYNACNSSPERKRASINMNVCSQCNKLFYNESCFNNHLAKNRCTEYSYRCDTC